MKKVVIILLVLCNLFSFAQGTWEKKALPTIQYLRSVCFTDSLYGWIAGDSGIMLHTTNGGNSWVQQITHTGNEITDVLFINRNQGWASALNYAVAPYGTELLRTSNGGATWEKYPYPDENIFITSIFYFDSLNGWMGGRPHAIAKTTDGGLTWAQATVDTSILAFFPVLTIQFYNEQYGYASGGMFDIAGVIWRTSDGGNTWHAMDASDAPADEVHGIHMFDSITVMGAGGDPDFGYGVGMIRTTDGGINWDYDELEIQGNAYDLDFRSATEVWAPLGTRQKLIYSLDGGTTWTDIIAPDSASIFDVTFPDSLHGYAVGRHGAFLKYHPPVVPFVAPSPVLNSSQFRLYQNIPNPVQQKTSFTFRVPAKSEENRKGIKEYPANIMIEIIDCYNRIVYKSAGIQCSEGEHTLHADLGKLPDGVYFYRLIVNGFPVSTTGANRLIVAK